MKKKKWKVYADSITLYEAEVEAETEEEANRIAHEQLDGSEYKQVSDGDWQERTDLTQEV